MSDAPVVAKQPSVWRCRVAGAIGILTVALVACADDDPMSPQAQMPGPKPSAGLRFADVHPVFTAKCSDAGCHGGDSDLPRFAQMDPMAAYAAGADVFEFMWGRLSSGNMPFKRGCASGEQFVEPPPPGCLTPTERTLIRDWLDQGFPK